MPDEQDKQGRIIRRGPYPELTLPAILVGYGLGILIALSIGYASLILGFSIEGSELAAILGFGILRGLMRRSSIIENNINQTIASAVNGASAGMMFSVPALFILGRGPGNGSEGANRAVGLFPTGRGGWDCRDRVGSGRDAKDGSRRRETGAEY